MNGGFFSEEEVEGQGHRRMLTATYVEAPLVEDVRAVKAPQRDVMREHFELV